MFRGMTYSFRKILWFWRFEEMTGDCMEFPGGVPLNRIGVPIVAIPGMNWLTC